MGTLCDIKVIETVRVDEGETYHDEERKGEIVLNQTQKYKWPVELPLPAGAIIRFPG